MALLLDTQVIVWIGEENSKLSTAAQQAIFDSDDELFVSAAVAFEFEDLYLRGRFGQVPNLSMLLERLDAEILPLPADVWRLASTLPRLHLDPVDRMLIAHALHADLTLVTADETIRRYPVKTLW